MPSATGGQVIYLPSERSQTLGSDIGGLIGATMVAGIRQKAIEQEQQIVGQFTRAVQQAPNRAAAMEVVSNYASQFKKPGDFTSALALVDKAHPVSLEMPTPVTAYKPDTGEATTVFPNRLQMGDPKYWDAQGVTLTKPDMADFYQQIVPPSNPTADANAKPGDPNHPESPAQFVHVGKLPVNKRPAGAVTLPELTLARQGQTEERQVEAGERADRRLADGEQRMADAEQRQLAVIGRLANGADDKAAKNNQAVVQSATRLWMTALGGKTLQDGSISFVDDNKKAQFAQGLDMISAMVDSNPKILKDPNATIKLFRAASKASPDMSGEKPKDDAAAKAAPAKTPGILDKAKKMIDDFVSRNPTDGSKTKMSADDQKSSVKAAQDAAAKVRGSSLNVSEKSAKLEAIRKRLKDNGLDPTVIDGGSGSGGGGGTDAMSPTERQRLKQAEDPKAAAAAKAGYDTQTNTQPKKMTPEQEKSFRGMLKDRGFTASQIDAEVDAQNRGRQ